MTTPPTTILLISGSLRSGSTNAAVLQTAQAIAPAGVDAIIYGGLESLPHFNPDHDADPLPPAASAFRHQLSAVDAVLFSTPEYAGALPGSLKNLLDWTVGDAASSGMPVGWINASARGGGAAGARASRTPRRRDVYGLVGHRRSVRGTAGDSERHRCRRSPQQSCPA